MSEPEAKSSAQAQTKASARRQPSTAENAAGRPPTRRPRLAAKVARDLEERILAGEWPVGYRIGREADLAVAAGVSRWTFREAVRILESCGLVASRKGASGGLYVASSTLRSVHRRIANYIQFVRVGRNEFGAVMSMISLAIADGASQSADPDLRAEIMERIASLDGQQLSTQLETAGGIYAAMVACAGDEALALLIGALHQVVSNSLLYSSLDDAQWHHACEEVVSTIAALASAAMSGDSAAIRTANEAYVTLSGRIYATSLIHLRKPIPPQSTERAYSFFPPVRPIKKAEYVEREIGEMLFAIGWPVGANLGSEKELAERFRVGRWVLREALRSLEQLGVIEMGRGASSGLRVISPDPTAIAEAARRHLHGRRYSAERASSLASLLDSGGDQLAGFLPLKMLFRRIVEPGFATGPVPDRPEK
jgi:DNA-binding FadR family transcriptional regulator